MADPPLPPGEGRGEGTARPHPPKGSAGGAASPQPGPDPAAAPPAAPSPRPSPGGRRRRTGLLITRPEPGASDTARLVAARGLDPVLAPLLHIHSLPLRAPPSIGAVLVTSGNAIPALPAALHALPLLAVGHATADRARQAGFANVHSADGDATDLLALARQHPRGPVMLASGEGQGAALASALREAGFTVHRRTAYAARPATRLPPAALDALGAGTLRAAMFLSAETARTFVRLLPQPLRDALKGLDALAIAQPTADVLAHLPWRAVRVSAKPTLERVLALL